MNIHVSLTRLSIFHFSPLSLSFSLSLSVCLSSVCFFIFVYTYFFRCAPFAAADDTSFSMLGGSAGESKVIANPLAAKNKKNSKKRVKIQGLPKDRKRVTLMKKPTSKPRGTIQSLKQKNR